MDALVARIRAVGAAFLDPWVVMDRDDRVVEFDARYRGLFSRAQARRLSGSTCCQFLHLSVCGDGVHLPRKCLQSGGPVRFDEIEAVLEGEDDPKRFIASATPIGPDEGPPEGTLIFLRDVSDIAEVQRKYRDLVERENREKQALRKEIARKTKELMDTNMELNRVQKDLLRFKKGLFG